MHDEFVLALPSGGWIRLIPGRKVLASDLAGVPPSGPGSAIARVTASPTDATVLGLTNLSAVAWQAEPVGVATLTVLPGKTVRLAHGTRLRMGGQTATIQLSAAMCSIAIVPGWRLRIASGPEAGQEHPLGVGPTTVGSAHGSGIVINDPTLAGRHLRLTVQRQGVLVEAIAGAPITGVDGASCRSVTLGPSGEFRAGSTSFVLVNQTLAGVAVVQRPRALARVPRWVVAGVATSALALALLAALLVSSSVNLVPVTLIVTSAVVPAAMVVYLRDRLGAGAISFQTLAGTFLLGGTVGIISTVVLGGAAGALSGGLMLFPVFAGVAEEPSKLLATWWRWKHPVYDKPLDGLLLGTVSGFGFAVFETAGYGLQGLLHGGLAGMVAMQALRGVMAPFGHGLWSGILGAAFWECGRSLPRAVRDRRFLRALGISVGLHALWNAGALLGSILPLLVSAVAGVLIYRIRLRRRGYSQ